MFDVRDHLDELRCWPKQRLLARRDELVREQRRLRVEELAVTRVLDELGALGPDLAARDGVSERTARTTLETARALESLPEMAAAAYDGRLSAEQLAPAVELADESSDHEWAERAQYCSPGDLARLARTKETPTVAEREQRVKAQFLHTWWKRDAGMFHFRGALPDVDGVFVEEVFNELIERMRPAKGQRWATPAHRRAAALIAICAAYEKGAPLVARPTPRFVVQIPPEGPAEIAGIPLPDEMVEALRAEAKLEPVAVDSFGAPVATGRVRSVLSEKIKRAVLLRDGHCRVGTCDVMERLQVHHLIPVSWGGTDDLSNLASVCALGPDSHHGMLVPYGEWVLEGNPNRPDGLRFVHISEATIVRPPPGWQRGRRAQPPEVPEVPEVPERRTQRTAQDGTRPGPARGRSPATRSETPIPAKSDSAPKRAPRRRRRPGSEREPTPER